MTSGVRPLYLALPLGFLTEVMLFSIHSCTVRVPTHGTYATGNQNGLPLDLSSSCRLATQPARQKWWSCKMKKVASTMHGHGDIQRMGYALMVLLTRAWSDENRIPIGVLSGPMTSCAFWKRSPACKHNQGMLMDWGVCCQNARDIPYCRYAIACTLAGVAYLPLPKLLNMRWPLLSNNCFGFMYIFPLSDASE